MGTVINNRLKAHVGVKDTRNVAEASTNVEALVVLGRARVADVVAIRVDLVGRATKLVQARVALGAGAVVHRIINTVVVRIGSKHSATNSGKNKQGNSCPAPWGFHAGAPKASRESERGGKGRKGWQGLG